MKFMSYRAPIPPFSYNHKGKGNKTFDFQDIHISVNLVLGLIVDRADRVNESEGITPSSGCSGDQAHKEGRWAEQTPESGASAGVLVKFLSALP